jgi:hypothetical protein
MKAIAKSRRAKARMVIFLRHSGVPDALAADYNEAARVERHEAARDSGMMLPTVTE